MIRTMFSRFEWLGRIIVSVSFLPGPARFGDKRGHLSSRAVDARMGCIFINYLHGVEVVYEA